MSLLKSLPMVLFSSFASVAVAVGVVVVVDDDIVVDIAGSCLASSSAVHTAAADDDDEMAVVDEKMVVDVHYDMCQPQSYAVHTAAVAAVDGVEICILHSSSL